jgi:hypothetical protein
MIERDVLHGGLKVMTKQKIIAIYLSVSFILLAVFSVQVKNEVWADDDSKKTTSITDKKTLKHNHKKATQLSDPCNPTIVKISGRDVLDVSMVQLIATPKKYAGKYVRLIGFVGIEFEGDAVFLHSDDYKHRLTKNGLWLDLPEDFCGKNLDQKYVLIEGTFNPKRHGHMDLFSGSIENIKRFQEWRLNEIIRDKSRK